MAVTVVAAKLRRDRMWGGNMVDGWLVVLRWEEGEG